MGAWIEICCHLSNDRPHQVAPFMGAWIEIIKHFLLIPLNGDVAPFMGAWIEMSMS